MTENTPSDPPVPVRTLSKSKLIAFRQCPKRLWLELHKPELRDDSGAQARFEVGYQVGDLAQKLYDPESTGTLIDINELGWKEARDRSAELLKKGKGPIFEATMRTTGALALADVMLPDRSFDSLHWKMIEVKSSTGVKDYHRDDVAIQTYIARKCGIRLSAVAVAHIDTSFVYPGDANYDGILKEVDLTGEAKERHDEVDAWIGAAQTTAALDTEPEIAMGDQCTNPFPCSFCSYCAEGTEAPEDPFASLPNLNWKRREAWECRGITALEDIPDDQLTDLQTRVREATLSGVSFFDAEGAANALAPFGFPAHFLDFETVMFAIPIWKGTRPYQQLPFQYSLHRVDATGDRAHREFLNLDGSDPRRALAEAMIRDCGTSGPVFVYNATFERRVIQCLAGDFPDLEDSLNALVERLVDLHPIARNHYYHPSQGKSWSLKAVTPAICPELSYESLEGVQVGSDAGTAYIEAISPKTTPGRREELRHQLLEYCKLDTLATVEIWEYFRGRKD